MLTSFSTDTPWIYRRAGPSQHRGYKQAQSLLFTYPLGLDEDLHGLGSCIRPVVRLEFGCRGDVWPSERQPIRPYIADALPGIFAQPTAGAHVLRPERTFWEKATLLHAVYHSGKTPPRLSRHYYDLAACTGMNTGRTR